MSTMKNVFEKVKSDVNFAKELFGDPEKACNSAGITPNETEKKILNNTIQDVQKYFGEKLYLASESPDVLWNAVCGIFTSC